MGMMLSLSTLIMLFGIKIVFSAYSKTCFTSSQCTNDQICCIRKIKSYCLPQNQRSCNSKSEAPDGAPSCNSLCSRSCCDERTVSTCEDSCPQKKINKKRSNFPTLSVIGSGIGFIIFCISIMALSLCWRRRGMRMMTNNHGRTTYVTTANTLQNFGFQQPGYPGSYPMVQTTGQAYPSTPIQYPQNIGVNPSAGYNDMPPPYPN
uniref:Uncharacterized LOC100186537 n=1 Tax=Ciona intestinalis TaxID=7719 RepID=H2Y1L3_CIOIN|nr:uncharacterized protein LOC100186537 [Ciona intestinalis]|eukprot:XP_002123425.1 uncharacterized protein LOC100186537 [Ciona intestinalis]